MMKMTKKTGPAGLIPLLTMMCLLITAGVIPDQGKELDAAAIMKKNDGAEGFESVYMEMDQTITTTGGKKRTLGIRFWAVNSGEKQLAEYLSPADIKGQKILMTEDGDNIWMFNPETRRTRKLGSHMKKKKIMGSDFTYEDQAGGKMSEKYTGTLLREEKLGEDHCYVLDLKPTPKGPSYGKIIAWIGKDDFIVRRVDYFREKEEEPFKRLTTGDIRKVGKKRVPFDVTMTNLEDRSTTVNRLTRVQFDVDIPGAVFESRTLER